MLRRLVAPVVLPLVLSAAWPSLASAQHSLGTFRWQLAPFCNVVTVTVTQAGSTFALDGFDDQCGAATGAAVVGTAFPNPNGSIGIGLSLVATPGAAPVHIDVALALATLGGPWRDSAGHTGTFTFNPPTPAPGTPRPPTGGLISGITPGTGLIGGGTTGAVSLAVFYGGTGSAITAARSDHTHAAQGMNNTAVGTAALFSNKLGSDNTATGSRALDMLTTGHFNSAFGADALGTLTTGERNTAVGAGAQMGVASGSSNTAVGTFALLAGAGSSQTAVGAGALQNNASGEFNTAVGANALGVATGSRNVAIGREALGGLKAGNDNVVIGSTGGITLTSGNNNIYIGGDGLATENATIRIGAVVHSATFIGGIHGASVNSSSDAPVLVDSTGKLGTAISSARFKEHIHPLDDISRAISRLEPVTFRYTPDQQRGSDLQYGLIAEQVAEVMPELVINDRQGRPLTVKYHLLPTLLLAEVQRLERERAEQARLFAEQTKAIDELREELRALRSERR